MLLTTQDPLNTSIPLVLDLDGTLIRTDTFHEMMIYLLVQKPWILFRLPIWFLKGRPYVKALLVEHTDMSVDLLPYNKYLLSFAQKESEQGRPLVLATGTDQKLAQKISDHLGIFQDVIGSDGMINMTGQQKRQALLDRFGKHGFDYAGDSSIDTFVWQVSRKALVVCPKWGVLKKVRALKNAEHLQYFPRNKKRVIALFLALRPLFWVFNLMASTVSFFVGLSFLSTGLLILNDLLVVEQERKEPYKKKSVFAEGDLHLITAFTLAPLFIILSLFLLLSMPGGGFYIGGYSLLFIGLDRFTRSAAQPLRWTLLGLFQTFAALMSGI